MGARPGRSALAGAEVYLRTVGAAPCGGRWRLRRRSGPGAPSAAVGLTRLGEGVDRVVVLVAARESLGVAGLDAGAVVLGPVRDPLVAVVLLHLVHPALADERHVAHDARRGEARQVAHDVVLQLLGLVH